MVKTVNKRRKLPSGQSLEFSDRVRDFWTKYDRDGQSPVRGLRRKFFFPKFAHFFQNLILELYCFKWNETWTQGSPQHQEQVPKRVFFSSLKSFLSILDELEELGFGEIGRNPRDSWGWIHSKNRGR
jgi:hypothetical protein